MKKKKEKDLFHTPLNQQEISSDEVFRILTKTLKIEVKETSTKTGFLMDCPKCQEKNKLFYSFDGKSFICLNYKDCYWKCSKFIQLRQQWKQTKREKQTNP